MSVQIVKLLDPLNPTIITGGLVPRGAYDNATDYAVGDSVDYLGSSYVMYVNAASGVLPTDTTKWQVLANKGTTGATGATGSTGSAGATGSTGQGVPVGGSSGQVLAKSSATDYDTTWSTAGAGDMVLASVQSVTGKKTFDSTKLAVKGSSTGVTTVASANAGATDYTATLKAETGTVALISDITGTNSGTNSGDNATNTQYSGLVSNATHTGEVTGATALTVDKTAITGKTAVTAVGTDYILISDTSDTGNLKKALASDLTSGGGGIAESLVVAYSVSL